MNLSTSILFVKPKIHLFIQQTFKGVCPYQAFKLCAVERGENYITQFWALRNSVHQKHEDLDIKNDRTSAKSTL